MLESGTSVDQIRKCIYYPLHPSLRGPKTFSLHNSTSKKDLRNGLKCSGWGWGGGDALPPFPPSPICFQGPGHYLLTLDPPPPPPPPFSYAYSCLHKGSFGIKSVNLFLQYIKCHESFFPGSCSWHHLLVMTFVCCCYLCVLWVRVFDFQVKNAMKTGLLMN